jgi:fructose-1,6-bisphosphatase I
VLTTGRGVDMFVLDSTIGSFVLVKRQLRIPETHRSYSVNEANRLSFPEGYRRYLDWAHANGYSSRYIGSMVADLHRILLKGGVFLYPPTTQNPGGKLRLMYEGNPMAMIVEQAGGKGLVGALHGDNGVTTTRRLLEVQPATIHQRTSVVIGSPAEVDRVMEHLR